MRQLFAHVFERRKGGNGGFFPRRVPSFGPRSLNGADVKQGAGQTALFSVFSLTRRVNLPYGPVVKSQTAIAHDVAPGSRPAERSARLFGRWELARSPSLAQLTLSIYMYLEMK